MVSRTELQTSKSEAVSSRGMVTAMQPLAAEAGIEILERGGNAVDAAVAVGFAIGVVEPFNSGLGGIAVFVSHDPTTGRSLVIDGTAPLPNAIRPDVFTLRDSQERSGLYKWRAVEDDANNTGHLAVAVPGMPACLCEAHQRLGRLPLADVLAPAIRLADDGFLLDWYVAHVIALAAARLWKYPAGKEIFFNSAGTPRLPVALTDAAERLVQRDLAATLRRIAAHGADGFYRGETARLIAEDMAANGGLLTEDDLAAYRVRTYDTPLRTDYHEFQLLNSPVTNGGPTVVEMLNILEPANLADLGQNSAAALHLIIEAERRAFLDRFAYLGDPAVLPVPLEGLVAKAFAAARRGEIEPLRATPHAAAGNPWSFQAQTAEPVSVGHAAPDEGCTTHFNVIDGNRHMVSVTSTLGGNFGAAVVPPGTGIVLNNGVMWFDPEPGSPTTVGPGKRIMTAGTPTLVLRRGEPFLALGAPGGRRVISAIHQSLLNMLDYGMGPRDAIEAPRVHCEGPAVEIDSRIPAATIDALRDRGHELIVREQTPAMSFFARPTGIMVDPETGVLRGGATQYGPAIAIGL